MRGDAVFRWAAWQPSRDLIFMLDFSVASFRHWFGEKHRYVVFTDDPGLLQSHRRTDYEIRLMDTRGAAFSDGRATWKKWAPVARLDRTRVEFRIDADIFLLVPSEELQRFCEGRSPYRFVSTQEEFSEAWPYGNFAARLRDPRTPINAGFIGQTAGADITADLDAAYRIWKNEVAEADIKYHDEQGAVAYALEPYIDAAEVMLLDPARYRVVCPLNKPPVESLAGVTLLHATYPDHPAFYRFLPELSLLTGLPAEVPEKIFGGAE
jgi:hypothetical protein